MTHATTAAAGTGVNVLQTIKSNLRHRPVWSARELRNAVVGIADAHGLKRKAIAAACGVDDSTVSKALIGSGGNRGNNQFDYLAIALGFEPCGSIEYRTYRPSSIERVAA